MAGGEEPVPWDCVPGSRLDLYHPRGSLPHHPPESGQKVRKQPGKGGLNLVARYSHTYKQSHICDLPPYNQSPCK